MIWLPCNLGCPVNVTFVSYQVFLGRLVQATIRRCPNDSSPAWTVCGPAWIMLTSLLPALPAPSPRLMGRTLATVSLLRQESNKALLSGGCTSHFGLTSPPAPLLLTSWIQHRSPPPIHPPCWSSSNTHKPPPPPPPSQARPSPALFPDPRTHSSKTPLMTHFLTSLTTLLKHHV